MSDPTAPDPIREALAAKAEVEAAYAKRIGRPAYAAAHLDGMIARLRAALSDSTPSAPTLDAAWKAVEEALPDGWHIAALASDGAANPGWYIEARSAMVGGERVAASGPTPAAALLALAARLHETPRPEVQSDDH